MTTTTLIPPARSGNLLFNRDVFNSLWIALLATGVSYLLALAFGWIHSVNFLEAFAVFTSYSCTWLCVRQRRFNYVIGAISVVAYGVLFFQANLFSSALLQAYLLPTLIYGWWRWRRDSDTRPVTWTKLRWYPLYLLGGLAAYFAIYFGTTALGAHLAALDSGILVASILAQLAMDNKRLENWIVWFAIDIVATGEYFTSGLYIVAFQYLFFLYTAVQGFYDWRKSMKAQVSV
jgi:nicotinamide mononucleotide transporter